MVQIKEATDLTYLEPLALLFEGYRKFYKQVSGAVGRRSPLARRIGGFA